MIYVIASVRVKPGKVSEFLEVFKANVPDVKNEKGCIDYVPHAGFQDRVAAAGSG